MKDNLIEKLEILFNEFERAENIEEANFCYAEIKGFLSAIFELAEFNQSEIENYFERQENIMKKWRKK